MLLDIESETRCREWVDAALELRRQWTRTSEGLIREFVGCDYRAGTMAADEDIFENHAYEWCLNVVPSYISANPQLTVTDMGIDDDQTQLYTRVLRSLVERQNPKSVLRSSALDMQFDFGVLYVDSRPTPGRKFGSAIVPHEPIIRRLSPRQYARDPDTAVYGRCRGEFHLVVMSRRYMASMTLPDGSPKYRPDRLERVAAISGLNEFLDDMLQDGWDLDRSEDDLIVVAEIFDATRGAVISFAPGTAGGGVFLSDWRPHVGAEQGQYVMMMSQEVPEQVYGLAPLVVTKRIAGEVNQFRRAAAKDAETAKRLTIIGGKSNEIIAMARNAESGSVLAAQHFNGKVASVDTGGVNPEIYKALQVAREGRDRLSGLTDTIRGNLTGVTAGEIQTAQASATARMEYGKGIFRDAIGELYLRVLQTCEAREDFVFPIAYRDPESGQMVRSVFYGGPAGGMDELNDFPFKPAYRCSVEPRSMEYVNQTLHRDQLLKAQQGLFGIVQAMRADPAIKGRAMIDDLFDSLNMPKTSDRYYDFQAAAEMMARGMQMQQAAAMAGAAGGAQ